jgi:hypothetical protein
VYKPVDNLSKGVDNYVYMWITLHKIQGYLGIKLAFGVAKTTSF